jgi:Na+-driven multidrug efflux pump
MKLYLRTKDDESSMLFPSNALRRLIIPLILEQLLAVTIGIADSVMVASVAKQQYQVYPWLTASMYF